MSRVVILSCLIELALSTTAALPAPAPEPDHEAKAVVDHAIQAKGGWERLEKYKAVTYKLTASMTEDDFKATISGVAYEQAPDKMKADITVEVDNMRTTMVQVVNGDKAYEAANGTTELINEEEVAILKHELYVSEIAELRGLKADGVKVSLAGEAKIGDRPAIIVKATCAGRPDVKLYFDKASSLLLKVEDRTRDTAKFRFRRFCEGVGR
jgi:hypothetical protein